MNFLIDGHNLIGSNLFPDIHLSDEDDEAKLVRRLGIWQSRITKTHMTVIFDRGIPGGRDVKMGGPKLEVIFAADPAQADDLIRMRLRRAKRGLVLVSNDEALLRDATIYGVMGWRGEDFVERMRPKIPDKPEAGTEVDLRLTEAEVNEWLALFREARRQKLLRREARLNAAKADGKVDAKAAAKSGQKPGAKAKPMSKPVSKVGKKSPASPPPPPAKPTNNTLEKRRKPSGKDSGKKR